MTEAAQTAATPAEANPPPPARVVWQDGGDGGTPVLNAAVALRTVGDLFARHRDELDAALAEIARGDEIAEAVRLLADAGAALQLSFSRLYDVTEGAGTSPPKAVAAAWDILRAWHSLGETVFLSLGTVLRDADAMDRAAALLRDGRAVVRGIGMCASIEMVETTQSAGT
jgi:hypothetical protein